MGDQTVLVSASAYHGLALITVPMVHGALSGREGFAGLLGVATCANVRNWLVGVKKGLIFHPGLCMQRLRNRA